MNRHEEVVFQTKDRMGRSVRLRKVVFQRHLPDHPEMAGYVDEAAITVSDPDYEYREEEDNEGRFARIYYKKGLGRDKFEKCFIKVPVYYDNDGAGEVATFHFTRRLDTKGKLLWQREENGAT